MSSEQTSVISALSMTPMLSGLPKGWVPPEGPHPHVPGLEEAEEGCKAAVTIPT